MRAWSWAQPIGLHRLSAPRSSGTAHGGGPAQSLEDLLTGVDEFVGLLNVLCSDSSHAVIEGGPGIYERATQAARLQLGQQA